MPGYTLFCTTCKKAVESRAAWISHLLHEGHQRAARSEIGRWGKTERKTALVVYASFPVSTTDSSSSGGLSLLEHFSTPTGFLVTDFVAIPELPQVAVVQFESKIRATEVLEKAGGAKVSINGQLVQLRKAEDVLNLEWQALLSKLNSDFDSAADKDGGEAIGKKDSRKRKRIDADDDDGEDNDNSKKTSQASPGNLLQLAGGGPRRAPNTTITTPSNFRTQYNDLCTSVHILDEEFNIVLQFLNKLEELAVTKMPLCKLYIFRTYHLKLRTVANQSKKDELHVFIDAQGRASGYMSEKGDRVSYGQAVKCVFSTSAEDQMERQVGVKFRRRVREGLLQNVAKFECYHQTSGTKFTILPEVHPWLVVEVQACRLLEYLWSFDVRVQPLYTLIFYWTNMNNVKLSSPELDFNELTVSPEPAAMEWLIMLFLCHKKVVPTPREILDRESPGPGRRVPVLKGGVDIGFCVDPEFAEARRKSAMGSIPDEASDEFLMCILELAQDFFNFYSGLGAAGSWILNTKDGEVFTTTDFADGAPGFSSRLTTPEREMIRGLRASTLLRQVIRKGNSIVLLHPLFLKHRLAFSYKMFIGDVIPVMKSTANKLQQFLQDESYRDEVLTSRVINLKYLFHE